MRIFRRMHVLEVFVSGRWGFGKGEEGEDKVEGVKKRGKMRQMIICFFLGGGSIIW